MSRRKGKYQREIIALDMQTSSFVKGNDKVSIVYNIHVQHNKDHYNFRSIEEYMEYMEGLTMVREASPNHRLVVYVHDLPYFFMHFKRYENWDEESVFIMTSEFNTIKACTVDGVEYRCAKALTGLSMDRLVDYMGIERGTGEALDIEKIRHSETPISDGEMDYIKTNTEAIVSLIKLRLKDVSMRDMPSTVTGFLRRDMKRSVQKSKSYKNYVKSLKIDPDIYPTLKDSFYGGYVHANENFRSKLLHDVTAYDMVSQHPSILAQFTFPSGPGVDVTDKVLDDKNYINDNLKGRYHYTLTATFYNLKSKNSFPFISKKRADDIGDHRVESGNVIQADWITITMTDVDLKNLDDNYSFDNYKVHDVIRYEAAFIPKEAIEYIIGLFKLKSDLKGVKGKEEDYRMAKIKLNSVSGMMASDPVMRKFSFDNATSEVDELRITKKRLIEDIDKHNKSRNRFLYYPWGIWIGSYSRLLLNQFRRELSIAGIEDYYCDTDSRYVKSDPRIQGIVDKINDGIDKRIKRVCDHYNINYEDTRPKSMDGLVQPLGHWLKVDDYKQFKVIGPKRYAVIDQDDNFSITVSGLDKTDGKEYILSKGGMEAFTSTLYVPKEFTGKRLAIFEDKKCSGSVVDYQGITGDYDSLGHVYIKMEDFGMSLFDTVSKDMSNKTGLNVSPFEDFIKDLTSL